MYTHKQVMTCVHVDCIPTDVVHPVRTERGCSEYPAAMHGYPSALESGFRTYVQELPMWSRDRSRLFEINHFQPQGVRAKPASGARS